MRLYRPESQGRHRPSSWSYGLKHRSFVREHTPPPNIGWHLNYPRSVLTVSYNPIVALHGRGGRGCYSSAAATC